MLTLAVLKLLTLNILTILMILKNCAILLTSVSSPLPAFINIIFIVADVHNYHKSILIIIYSNSNPIFKICPNLSLWMAQHKGGALCHSMQFRAKIQAFVQGRYEFFCHNHHSKFPLIERDWTSFLQPFWVRDVK